MAVFLRGRGFRISRLQSSASLLFKNFNHTLTEGGLKSQSYREMDIDSVIPPPIDTSKWRKIDAKLLGIKSTMVSLSCWTVVNLLKRRGFDCYLVGGCVRDLILNRAPKDFDVITTADLKQIRKQFLRAQIIGKRFPICQVWIKGSIIEVSSFDTVAHLSEKGEERGKELPFQIPLGCDEKDFDRWRNSLKRDFTVNSLFLDPFRFTIYDYANGMTDLMTLKLRTLIPAHLSFEEDCARILRGLRIAARLNLSFSKDTEAAIHKCALSVKSLDQFRLMMEMNYMLSYGAAGPSILVLRRFNILRMVLPFQAEYLEEAHRASPKDSLLLQLFFNMDKSVFCDRPAHCQLWITLLAFHTALVHHSQDALVIRTLASVLYQGSWTEGVKFAREEAKWLVKLSPEISETSKTRSDEELAEEVTRFLHLIQESVNVLTETKDLLTSCSRFPDFHFSGLVFVPRRQARQVAELFDDLADGLETCEARRESFTIDYKLLGRGDPGEIRFVLGKIILDTLKANIVGQNGLVFKTEKHTIRKLSERNGSPTNIDPVKNYQTSVKKDRKHGFGESTIEPKQEMSKNHQTSVKKDRKHGPEVSNTEPMQEASKDHQTSVKEDRKHEFGESTTEPKQETSKNHQTSAKEDREHEFEESTAEPKQETSKNHQTSAKEDREHEFEESTAEPKQETSKNHQISVKKDKKHGFGDSNTEPTQETSKNHQTSVKKDRTKNHQTSVKRPKKDGKHGFGESTTEPKQETSKNRQTSVKKVIKHGFGESNTEPKQETSKDHQTSVKKARKRSNTEPTEETSKNNQTSVKKARKRSNTEPTQEMSKNHQISVKKDGKHGFGESTTEPKQETSKNHQTSVKKAKKPGFGESYTEPTEETSKNHQISVKKDGKHGFGESTKEPKQETSKNRQTSVKKAIKHGFEETITEPKQETSKNRQTSVKKAIKHGFEETITEPKQETVMERKLINLFDDKHNKSMQEEGIENLDSNCLKVVEKSKRHVSVDNVGSRDEMVKPKRLSEEKDAKTTPEEKTTFGEKSRKSEKRGNLKLSSLFR